LKFITLTWDKLYWQIVRLAEKVEKSGYKPDIIVGIARGGWVVARIMSDLLDNPNVASIRVEFYRSVAETKEKPTITQPVSTDVRGKRVLLVDDVADTGESILCALEHLKEKGAKEVKVAVVHKKPWSKFEPDYYVELVDAWIIYPHEYKETIRELTKRMLKEGIRDPNEIRRRLLEIGLSEEVVDYFLPKVMQNIIA